MTHPIHGFRLGMLPLTAKVVVTIFVLLVGFGYATSLAYLFFSYGDVDGKPGVTAEDVRLAIHGKRDKTKLQAMIDDGPMEQYLKTPQEKATIIEWIHQGSDQGAYQSAVKPILEKRCVNCHRPGGEMKQRPLTNFQEVAAVSQTDTGESIPAWARVAHIHLMSLSMTFLILGLIFAFTHYPDKVKIPLVLIPFLSLGGDFGSRVLVRYNVNFVYIVMLCGATMALSTLLICMGIFHETWLRKPRSGAPATLEPASQAA